MHWVFPWMRSPAYLQAFPVDVRTPRARLHSLPAGPPLVETSAAKGTYLNLQQRRIQNRLRGQNPNVVALQQAFQEIFQVCTA